MSQMATPQVMQAHGEKAVAFARANFSAKLDFSGRSIKSVESILKSIHEFLKSPDNTWTDGQLWSFCLVFGGYVGEVLRREWGGEWLVSPLSTPVLKFSDNGGRVSTKPCEKVYKRLTDGPDDNIYQYYESLARAIVPALKQVPFSESSAEEITDPQLGSARVAHSSGAFSIRLPAGWKSYERKNSLSAYPPDGQSLISFTGNSGSLAFEEFVKASVVHQPPLYTPVGSPRDIDAINAIGRCFEFSMHEEKGTSAALACCLQCPTYMIFVMASAPAPLTAELKATFDSIICSVLMRE